MENIGMEPHVLTDHNLQDVKNIVIVPAHFVLIHKKDKNVYNVMTHIIFI